MKYLALTALIILILMPSIAMAQESGINTKEDVVGLVEDVRDLIWTIGFILIAIFLLLAGITYLTARGDETKIENAKKQFKYALIGAVIIIGAQVIITTLRAIVGQGTLFPN